MKDFLTLQKQKAQILSLAAKLFLYENISFSQFLFAEIASNSNIQ